MIKGASCFLVLPQRFTPAIYLHKKSKVGLDEISRGVSLTDFTYPSWTLSFRGQAPVSQSHQYTMYIGLPHGPCKSLGLLRSRWPLDRLG